LVVALAEGTIGSRKLRNWATLTIPIGFIVACGGAPALNRPPQEEPVNTVVDDKINRNGLIPAQAIKISPTANEHPPILHSGDYEAPAPVPGGVNTAGAEDSPFITPDGNTSYFFFTPDVHVPVEEQILDGVTGINLSRNNGGVWGEPQRVILQDKGKISGDGCEFVRHETIYSCTVWEGYTGIHWFTAEYWNGRWQNWKIADFDPDYEVGELHITSEGTELYFGSERAGGKGNLDIWVSLWVDEQWGEPVNVAAVNTSESEGWPAVTPDSEELWFTRNNEIWRSKNENGEWLEAEQIISSLAGEPSIDDEGNLYFVHHYYSGGEMIAADLYVAYKK